MAIESNHQKRSMRFTGLDGQPVDIPVDEIGRVEEAGTVIVSKDEGRRWTVTEPVRQVLAALVARGFGEGAKKEG